MKELLLVMAVFLLIGVANAAVTWNAPGPDAGDWGVSSNWSPATVPTSADEVYFNGTSTVECQVTGSQIYGQLRTGDGGTAGILRLMRGATLNGGQFEGGTTWTAVGFDNPATVIVERGASWHNASHFYVGRRAGSQGSILEINGGTLTNTVGSFAIGSDNFGGGHVYFNAGLISVWRDLAPGFGVVGGTDSSLDICFGTLIINRDDLQADLEADVAAGYITAFGEDGDDGTGAEIVIFTNINDGTTTVTAINDPLERTPTYDKVLPNDNVDLSWVNLGTSPVWVDVWFGTSPDSWSKLNTEGPVQDMTTIVADASIPDEYAWRVDTYLRDPASDPNVIEGFVMYFESSNDLPPTVEIDTPRTATWVNEPITLQATISDDSVTDVTVTWSVDEDDPNVTWTDKSVVLPGGTVYPKTVSATIALDYLAGVFDVTVTVGDESAPNYDSKAVEHSCSLTACRATIDRVRLGELHPADFARSDEEDPIGKDCICNLLELERIAREWTTDYRLSAPKILP